MEFSRRNSRWEHFHLLKGVDCNDQFIRLIRKVNKTFVKSLMGTDFPLNWTQEEREKSKKATTCHICGRKKVEASWFIRILFRNDR